MATYQQGLRSWIDGSPVPDLTPEEGRAIWLRLYGPGAPFEWKTEESKAPAPPTQVRGPHGMMLDEIKAGNVWERMPDGTTRRRSP